MAAQPPFTDVPGALEEIKAGRMIVVVDDEDRENEGDLTLAAEFVTPEAINFMAKYGRGLICLTLTEERADYLRLTPMVQQNSSRFGTAFTESIEAREGVTTGISAHDRAHTIRVAIDPRSTANDLARPGHVFPLRARKGGVLVRAGQTEASVDLARMAGLVPAGVICEIMKDDGTMARVPDLIEFCQQHGMKMLTVAELIRYRLQNERYIFRVAETDLPTPYGDFRMIAYESEVNGDESHLALVRGDVDKVDDPVLVRVHSHCLAGDVFGATLCDCHSIVQRSLKAIADAGCGALIYLHNTSRGFEIDRSVAPHRIVLHREARQREARDERHQRILRQVGLGGQILADLGIHKVRLLSNTPTHVPALHGFGVEIVEQVPVPDMGEVLRS
ncbi:3,4-dihydroxy-2-butanone-4-phosphate synthase [Pseudacidobacterium ailaaui]|jgi:3,4-dihydroxy 2-butanone 4-phosphate synthase/GTP cyclohydrolase II|uniref:3,4-dihydroxy-2-butanone-4-phosphate synthase n=1 Tax=Pseudacidobacterium ailaaui TaxID=1382359 RepID=UPI00047B34BC|nr:3,4-dihydroxy-2-butanone-4-phosphate synthase [Pseudacidobacterium ailaaui]MBX6359220.1 3,4-dihydroxy-2-butanone-4-phosphate synthase [Pseudacidobacterium ailaaui]MDI3255881.1 3,4-dihydroxy-2-butanone-4-phosphate synthase [Bacillota bacterium]